MEATITIDGHTLTVGQSMSVRVALRVNSCAKESNNRQKPLARGVCSQMIHLLGKEGEAKCK